MIIRRPFPRYGQSLNWAKIDFTHLRHCSTIGTSEGRLSCFLPLATMTQFLLSSRLAGTNTILLESKLLGDVRASVHLRPTQFFEVPCGGGFHNIFVFNSNNSAKFCRYEEID
jgi:hypothetical protein